MRNDGVLFVCTLDNAADNGDMPREVLTKKYKYWFENRTVGINRQYLAKGVNEQVDLVVRIAKAVQVRIGMYAMLGNGEQFRITHVTTGHETYERHKIVDKYYYRKPAMVDLDYTELTLMRLENNYDLATD